MSLSLQSHAATLEAKKHAWLVTLIGSSAGGLPGSPPEERETFWCHSCDWQRKEQESLGFRVDQGTEENAVTSWDS